MFVRRGFNRVFVFFFLFATMNVYNIQNTPAGAQPYDPSVPTAIVVDAEPVYPVPSSYPQGPSPNPNGFVQAPAPTPVSVHPNYYPSATPAVTEYLL